MRNYFFGIISIIFTLTACDQIEKGVKGDYLPEAKGATGEIILIMDTAKWNTPLGKELREVFYAPMPGLLQREPVFQVRRVHSTQVNDLLLSHKNLIYVAPFEGNSKATRRLRNMFSEKSKKQIRNDPDQFYRVRDNVYAKGQKVLYLFAETDSALTARLDLAHTKLRNVFAQAERKRLLRAMYKKRTQDGIEAKIRRKHGATFAVPFDYDLVKNVRLDSGRKGFAHIRRIDNTLNVDRNIFMAYKPYVSERQVEPFQLIAWRDSICKNNIYDIERPEIYIETETLVPADPKFKQEEYKGRYALEMRGSWRFTVQTGGGPFVSYIIVDEKTGRLYYIEGFVYAPGRSKRELIRELETGLWTLAFGSEGED